MEPSSNEVLHHCPICRGRHHSPLLRVEDKSVSHEVFTLVECTECGFCFTNPRPSPTNIGRYYEDLGYISHGGTGKGLQESIYRLIRRWAIRSKHRMVARYFATGNVLDVGCGTGEFLKYLKGRGYNCTGVEPSLRAREQAMGNHSLDVFPDITEVSTHEHFHIASLWHVLEHVHDPKEELGRIRSRLSPGGIVVIAVPNRESWDAKHYGPDWAAYDVPRHLSHFRRRDMARLLADLGFEMLEVRSMWFDAPFVSMLSERYRQAKPFQSFVLGLFVGVISNLVAIFGLRPTSSSIFIARRS